MNAILSKLMNAPKSLKLLAVAGVIGAAPMTAMADRWDHDHWHYDRGPAVGVYVGPGPVVVDHHDDVWVEPVYRTVTDHVYVPGQQQTVTDHVWVPDRYDWRDVYSYGRHGDRVVTRQWVLVDPGHYEDRPRTVEVTPGHYEDVQRMELVAPGHWEPRTVIVSPPPPHVGIDIHLPLP